MNYLKKNFINLLILVTGCISVIYINNKAEDVLEVSSSEIITIPDNLFNNVKYIAMDDNGSALYTVTSPIMRQYFNNETNLLDVASYRLAIHLNLALVITSFIFLLLKINYFFSYIGSMSISFGQFSFEKFKVSLFIIFLFLQITLGALVSGIDAGKSYNEWPLMNNNFVPEDYLSLEPGYLNFIENPATVQFNHRMLAYSLFFLVLLFFFFVSKYYSSNININSKNMNRSNINNILKEKISDLQVLSNDTNNVIEFNDGLSNKIKDGKQRSFWNAVKKNKYFGYFVS